MIDFITKQEFKKVINCLKNDFITKKQENHVIKLSIAK